jgi:transposase-like protein
VALTDSDLSELLDALRAGEMTDTIRTSLEWILQQLIEAEATAVIGAAPHQRTEGRTNQRNGHRPRLLSTAAGDVELKIPKLRSGSFFPSLLERRRRIDRARFAVVMEAWVHGVSTRKVDDLVAAWGSGRGSPSPRSHASAPSWTETSTRPVDAGSPAGMRRSRSTGHGRSVASGAGFVVVPGSMSPDS